MPNKVVRREGEDVHSALDMSIVIERILAEMIRAGFSAEDLFGMRVALEEAVVNALKHGNRIVLCKEKSNSNAQHRAS